MIALLLAAGCHGDDAGDCAPYHSSPGPPDCRDLGEPCSGCASYVDVPASCAGRVVDDAGGQTACEMDETVMKWCAIHLPCWLGPGCPNFHEFLFVSGWLTGLPRREPQYEWSWGNSEYAYYGFTYRCSRVSDGAEFEVFNWPPDADSGEERVAYFDATTGELVSVHEYAEPRCCGAESVDDRWWGPQVEPCSFHDYQYQSWWEECPAR